MHSTSIAQLTCILYDKSNHSSFLAIRLTPPPLCSPHLPPSPHSSSPQSGGGLRLWRPAMQPAGGVRGGGGGEQRHCPGPVPAVGGGPCPPAVRPQVGSSQRGNTARVHTYLAWTLPSFSQVPGWYQIILFSLPRVNVLSVQPACPTSQDRRCRLVRPPVSQITPYSLTPPSRLSRLQGRMRHLGHPSCFPVHLVLPNSPAPPVPLQGCRRRLGRHARCVRQ